MAIKTYQDSKDKYLREKVDTFVVRVPKGKKDEIAEFAASKGMSLNGYITSLVFADMGEPTDKKETKAKAPVKKTTSKPKVQKKVEKPVEPVAEQPKEEAPKRRNMPSFLL